MSYRAPHENVRIQVTLFLLDILKQVVEKLVRTVGGEEYVLLKELLEEAEFVPLILPQEIYIAPSKRRRVDMAFGGYMVFELKGDPSEFDEACRTAIREYLPSPRLSNARYLVITNFELWRIYKVKRDGDHIELEPIIIDKPKSEAKKVLKTQIIPGLKLQVPAHPDIVRKLFTLHSEELIVKIKEVFDGVKADPRVKSLYAAYSNIMSLLYGRAEEDFLEDLFARHTLMHMIALASLSKALGKVGKPEDSCAGVLLDIDVALPYLNWWRVLYIDTRYRVFRERFQRVVEDITLRVNLVDWDYAETEDVFRELYELLVDPETRRRIGEYYTPLWMVEYILNEFDLRDKIVLDPFCGSGTFLVMAFHKKVESGEDPDKAYTSLIGFDINPLAVTVARAELVIAYLRRERRKPSEPPHVYHTDTLAVWYREENAQKRRSAERKEEARQGEEVAAVPEVEALFRSAKDYLGLLIKFRVIELEDVDILKALSCIEEAVSKALNYAFAKCNLDEDCLREKISSHLKKMLQDVQIPLVKAFLEHAEKADLPRRLAGLVIKYSGNSVWGVVLASVYAPLIVSHLKPHIVVTNPPWIPITEFRAPYSDRIREKAMEILKNILNVRRPESIMAGGDIAALALYKALEVAREGVGFVMSREQAFYHRSPMPAGILLTYAVLRSFDCDIRLVDVDFDAFQHGIYPAIIIAKKRGEGCG